MSKELAKTYLKLRGYLSTEIYGRCFVLTGKRTPWDLHIELVRPTTNGLHGFVKDDCKIIRDWCLAAGQIT